MSWAICVAAFVSKSLFFLYKLLQIVKKWKSRTNARCISLYSTQIMRVGRAARGQLKQSLLNRLTRARRRSSVNRSLRTTLTHKSKGRHSLMKRRMQPDSRANALAKGNLISECCAFVSMDWLSYPKTGRALSVAL